MEINSNNEESTKDVVIDDVFEDENKCKFLFNSNLHARNKKK